MAASASTRDWLPTAGRKPPIAHSGAAPTIELVSVIHDGSARWPNTSQRTPGDSSGMSSRCGRQAPERAKIAAP